LPKKQPIHFRVSEDVSLVGDALGLPENPPVIFLHGGGQTRHAWKGTCQVLARARWYVINLDHRGHGDSSWAPDANYSLEAFADDLIAVAAQIARPVAVVGASLGGLAALLAGGEQGLQATAMVLVDIAPKIERAGAGRIFDFMWAKRGGFDSIEEAADFVATYTQHRTREKNLESLKKNLRKREDGRYVWHWDPRFLSEKGPTELRDHLRLYRAAENLTMPTLVVRGKRSDVVTDEAARELAAAIPRGEFVDVSDAGHMVAGDQNDAFTQAVVKFLEMHHP